MNGRLADLVERSIDRQLAPAEDAELAALLGDPVLGAEAVEQRRLALLIEAHIGGRPFATVAFLARTMRASQRRSRIMSAIRRRARRRSWRPWWIGAAVAALLAVLVGAWWQARDDARMATVVAMTGAVDAQRGFEPLTLTVGAGVATGDRLDTGPDGRVRLGFRDGSILDLEAGSGLRLDQDARHGGTRLELDHGGFAAQVAHQPSGRSFQATTPSAAVLVVGTRLRLRVEAGQTNLTVDEGRVRFTDSGSGNSVEVGAGGSARTPIATVRRSWSGMISVAAASDQAKPLQVPAWIPDLGKPVRAALIMGWAYDDPDWRAVAVEFNCLMISTTLNASEPAANAQRILAILERASLQFPDHPEIRYGGVVMTGWSQQAAGAALTACQPTLADRVVAVVGIHEIDARPHQAPRSVPRLYLSAWPDGYSRLLGGCNALVLAQAKDGAPITMVNDVGHDHIDVSDNYAFTRIWLEEVLKRRLPASAPIDHVVRLPDWSDDQDGWLGAYDVTEKTAAAPWGDGQRLENVVIGSRRTFTDVRQPIWLPSQHCAQVWQVFSKSGFMPAPGTLDPPPPIAPSFLVQPQDVTIVADQPFGFNAVVAGSPPPTYRWWRVKGAAKDVVSASQECWTPWNRTTDADYGATFQLVATNSAGSVASSQVRLIRSTAATAPPWIRLQPRAQMATTGETATFTVDVYGTPAPSLQWMRNGVDIPAATTASYTTPPVISSDHGATYSVRATNSAGGITSAGAALIVDPERLLNQP